VIAFPAGHGAHEPMVSRTRPGSRWIAAAAVAGLLVGGIAGRFATITPSVVPVSPASSSRGPRNSPSCARRRLDRHDPRGHASISDDEFLNQLEIAIDGPSAAALQPINELTPRSWEVR